MANFAGAFEVNGGRGRGVFNDQGAALLTRNFEVLVQEVS